MVVRGDCVRWTELKLAFHRRRINHSSCGAFPADSIRPKRARLHPARQDFIFTVSGAFPHFVVVRLLSLLSVHQPRAGPTGSCGSGDSGRSVGLVAGGVAFLFVDRKAHGDAGQTVHPIPPPSVAGAENKGSGKLILTAHRSGPLTQAFPESGKSNRAMKCSERPNTQLAGGGYNPKSFFQTLTSSFNRAKVSSQRSRGQ